MTTCPLHHVPAELLGDWALPTGNTCRVRLHDHPDHPDANTVGFLCVLWDRAPHEGWSPEEHLHYWAHINPAIVQAATVALGKTGNALVLHQDPLGPHTVEE